MLMALVICAGMAGTSFAQEKKAVSASSTARQTQTIKGKIVALDVAGNQVTVKEANGTERTFGLTAKEIASLKKDQEIKVIVKTGTSEVVKVKTAAGNLRKSKK